MVRLVALVTSLAVLAIPLAGHANEPALSVEVPAEEPAPDAAKEDRFSADLALNQDVFFGFYPMLTGSYTVTESVDFTFYSILWTIPAFGDGVGGGLWSEVGGGVSLEVLDGALALNPQLGVLNGSLLSGSDRPLAGEGIVPNLTVNYEQGAVESEIYFGYYLALRGARQNDFIHYWANAGIKPLELTGSGKGGLLSVGAHWEHLRLQRTAGGDATDIYRWVGPYARLALPNKASLWFGAGWDLEGNGAPDFYKASLAFAL